MERSRLAAGSRPRARGCSPVSPSSRSLRRAEQIEALLRLACLLERWAQRINLSGHRDVESIVGRLILDAAALAAHLPPRHQPGRSRLGRRLSRGSRSPCCGPSAPAAGRGAREAPSLPTRRRAASSGLDNVELRVGTRRAARGPAASARDRPGHRRALAGAALDDSLGGDRGLAGAARRRAPPEIAEPRGRARAASSPTPSRAAARGERSGWAVESLSGAGASAPHVSRETFHVERQRIRDFSRRCPKPRRARAAYGYQFRDPL